MNSINEFFSTTTFEALGWTLFHSIWQGLIIGALLFLFLLVFKKHSAQFRYIISVGALAMQLLLVIATLIYQFSIIHDPALPGGEPTGLLGLINFNLISTDPVPTISFFDQLTLGLHQQIPWIIMIWSFGVLIGLSRFVGGYIIMKRKIGHISALPNNALLSMVERLKNLLGIQKDVLVKEASFVNVPAIFGHFKPIILIPVGLINHLSPEQVEMILLHELAHIKRHDFIINILQTVCEVILFFNPAMWWISNEIKKERENCCDDIIVGNKHHPVSYIKTLAALNQFSISGYGLMPGILGNNKHQLLKRMQRLVPHQTFKRYQHQGYKFISLMFIIMASIVFASWFEKENNPESTNPMKLKEINNELVKSTFLPPISKRIPNKYKNPKVVKIDTTKKERTNEEIIQEQERKIRELEARIEEMQRGKRDRESNLDERININRDLRREISENMNLVREQAAKAAKEMERNKELIKKEMEMALKQHQLNETQELLSLDQLDWLSDSMANFNFNFDGFSMDFDEFRTNFEDIKTELNINVNEQIEIAREIYEDIVVNHQIEIENMQLDLQDELEDLKVEMRQFHEKVAAFQRDLLENFKKDKIIEDDEDGLEISEKNGHLIVNGKELTEEQSKKYKEIIKKFTHNAEWEDGYHFRIDLE